VGIASHENCDNDRTEKKSIEIRDFRRFRAETALMASIEADAPFLLIAECRLPIADCR
jgi:hypothetical protein